MRDFDFRIPITIAITGHRDVRIDEVTSIKRVFGNWLEELSKEYPNTPIRFLSGMAEGADRIAADAFLETREKLKNNGHSSAKYWEFIAVLPMATDVYQEDFPNSLNQFFELLERANDIILLPSPDPDTIRKLPTLREDCYEALGRHLIRHCNILAAFWDGNKRELRGGTSHIVRLKLEGTPNALSSFSIAVHDCGPVWHLPINRISTHPDHQINSNEPQWKYPVIEGMRENSFSKAFHAMDVLNEKTSNELNYTRLQGSAESLVTEQAMKEELFRQLGPVDGRVAAAYAAADALAIDGETKKKKWMMGLYLLGGALAICLWTAIDNVLQVWMSIGYIVITIMLLVGFRRIREPAISEDPLSYRFLAEALRIQFYWSVANTPQADKSRLECSRPEINWGTLRVLDVLLAQQALEIGWLREALRICAINPRKGAHIPDRLRREIVVYWFQEQLNYFKKTEKRYENISWYIDRVSLVFGVLAIVCATGVVFLDLAEIKSEYVRHALAIPAAVLPAFTIIVQSYAERMAYEEQQKSSIRMQSVFSRAKAAYEERTQKSNTQADVVRAVGQEALAECAYWLILRRMKPAKMPA